MYMDGLKYQNITLKFSLKGPVRTPHYLNTYIRFNMSNLTPLEQLIKYVKKRYETNTSFENLVEALKEEDETILETEKERAYNQGHSDGYNEALEANDNPAHNE